jgi:hypothetical protein
MRLDSRYRSKSREIDKSFGIVLVPGYGGRRLGRTGVRFLSIRQLQDRGRLRPLNPLKTAAPDLRPGAVFRVSQCRGYPTSGLAAAKAPLALYELELSAALRRCAAPAGSATSARTATLTEWVRRHVRSQRWLRSQNLNQRLIGALLVRIASAHANGADHLVVHDDGESTGNQIHM